ncbi:MAG: hypothetical protein JWN24_3062 [Phycisphaerales bacterium]|nr:hypothetical protein [Phycisphaerales bacterium]
MGVKKDFRGLIWVRGSVPLRAMCVLTLSLLAVGCQTGGHQISNRKLIEHQALLDFSGLDTIKSVEPVQVTCSMPRGWITAPTQRSALYTHQQWKSPSGYTGVGVVYAHIPFPLSAKALLWFAKNEYTKKADNGKALGEWDDEVGRPWFEAENNKYHVRGYAVTEGFSAWIVYFGYKTNRPPNPAELSLASRCLESITTGTTTVRPNPSNVAQGNKAQSQDKPG